MNQQVTIRLANAIDDAKPALEVRAQIDRTATFLSATRDVARQLGLAVRDVRQIRNDDQQVAVPYVGPVEVQLGSRRAYIGAVLSGTEVVLGA
jgi:hypothetical protein